MTAARTRLLGNLDCEHHWALRSSRGRKHRPRALPAAVLTRISLYATLLRVFAEEGDELWTPLPVDPACLRPVPGLPAVRLLSGPIGDWPCERRVIAWAAAPPWPLRPERVERAMRVNDRAFVLQNDWGLPEAHLVDSLEAFDAARPTDCAWVAKAPLSSAGRDRVIGAADGGSSQTRAALARLLRTHGKLVLEPWRERTLDFGLWGSTEAGASDSIGYHEQELDSRGRFRGIRILPRAKHAAGLSQEMRQAALDVRQALLREGYLGPFGIDGWHYRLTDGRQRTNLVGEINARLTFGRIAAELARRVAYPTWGSDRESIALRFGTAPETGSDSQRIPLVGSADGSESFVWLERLASVTDAPA